MKKIKKLLTSILVLGGGIVLNNMGITVVEATNALSSIELPILQYLQETQTIKRKTFLNLEQISEPYFMLSRDNISPLATTPDLEIGENNESILAQSVGQKIEYSIQEALKDTADSEFKQTKVELEQITNRGWNFGYDPQFGPSFPPLIGSNGLFLQIQHNLLFLYSDRDGFQSHNVEVTSTCGNWKLSIRSEKDGGL
ncbi:hypothetical protein VY361_000600 [Enterococcus faecium]|nr:hypothetical protein [Enterococcus faecium]EME5420706.1 hypothetical protein [Enterococcus faecium]